MSKSLNELLATQTLLQRAHDYIETHGFNIADYTSDSGERCYIGTVRGVAGLDPNPEDQPAASGDGAELVCAFKILDSVAQRRLSDDRKDVVKRDAEQNAYTLDSFEPIDIAAVGRYVESYGFQFAEEATCNQDEVDEALRIFRKALTKVYKKIEKARES
jgi:hypothetical protein